MPNREIRTKKLQQRPDTQVDRNKYFPVVAKLAGETNILSKDVEVHATQPFDAGFRAPQRVDAALTLATTTNVI